MNAVTDSVALHKKCWACISSGHLNQADQLSAELLKRRPNAAESWFTRGYVALQKDAHKQAIPLFDKAIALEKNNAEFVAARAVSLMNVGLIPEALSETDKAWQLGPENHTTWNLLAVVYHGCDELEKFLEVSEKAVEMSPDDEGSLANLSEALRYVGRYQEAEDVINQLIAHSPNATAYYNRSHIRKQTVDSNHISELEEKLQGNLNWREQMQLNFALAKELEDIGSYDDSFFALEQGCNLRRENSNYDVNGDIETIALIEKTFTKENLSPLVDGFENQEPVFVLGLPRSGTTLVEQILGAHSDVFDAGELRNFAIEMVKQVQNKHPGRRLSKQEMVRESLGLDWQALGKAYIESSRPRTGHTLRFVDKMPQNYLYVGLIARALPNAKIVLLERNPMDSCYAMYKTLFGQAYPFTYSQEDLGRYYVAWYSLMQHWKNILPGRIHRVRYEDMVSNSEAQTRQLLEFCELEWQPQCLEFYKRSSGVSTASASQVRQPIYSSSVNKWHHVKRQLQPLQKILNDAGIHTE